MDGWVVKTCPTCRTRPQDTAYPCGHQYCSVCVQKWLKVDDRCPLNCQKESQRVVWDSVDATAVLIDLAPEPTVEPSPSGGLVNAAYGPESDQDESPAEVVSNKNEVVPEDVPEDVGDEDEEQPEVVRNM